MANNTRVNEIGYATAVNNYLILANGLPNISVGEIVETENGAKGLVTALQNDQVEVLMLDEAKVIPNQMFLRLHQPFRISIGNSMIGRAINPLGVAIDGKGKILNLNSSSEIDKDIRGIKTRQFIKDQFMTGITTIDMLLPIAKGQRELIIGDARSGKTSFIIDLIVNQKVNKSTKSRKGVICVYGLIGRSLKQTRQIIDILTTNKAIDYTVIVAASSSELPSLIYLAPYTAMTLAEFFQGQGFEVLLILDDLGIHAKYYREISLLGNKIPGRDSYPGDIFHQHAKIIERGGKFNSENGGGSITILPVMEINLDDYTSFIPTNLMAMTDGHLMFNSALYHQGNRPAVDISLSVTRVGRQTQALIQKILSDRVRSILTEAKKVETLSRFGSEVSSETQLILKQSKQIEVILRQAPLSNIPINVQIIMLGLTFTKIFTSQSLEFVENNKETILSYLINDVELNKLNDQIKKFKNLDEFLSFIQSLEPIIEKICQT